MTTPSIIIELQKRYDPRKIDLSLDRIRRLLKDLGNPQENTPPIIHVAGTNGKGSTIAFLKSILEKAGKSVHTYTSPHLISFTERIRLKGKCISEEQLETLCARVEKINNNQPITFFEFTTAVAFLAYAENKADYLLLETGMGGVWDATNIITKPAITVLTPIDKDHQEFLGKTLERITKEKAGIMKIGCLCISAPQRPSVERLLKHQARKTPCSIVAIQKIDIAQIKNMPLGLIGDHQYENAVVAATIAKKLGIEKQVISEGLKTASHPARLHYVMPEQLIGIWKKGYTIVVDGTHNPHGVKALDVHIKTWDKEYYTILGLLKNRPLKPFLEALRGTKRLYAVGVPQHDCHSPENIIIEAKKMGIKVGNAYTLESIMHQMPVDISNAGRILLTGSLYLAGYALKTLGQHIN